MVLYGIFYNLSCILFVFSYRHKFPIFRQLPVKLVTCRTVVGAAGIMFQSVADEKTIHLQAVVVDGHLVKNFLRQFDMRRFQLNNGQRFGCWRVGYGIATFLHAVHIQDLLHGQQSGRKMQVIDQEMQKMLPDPFFGCQRNELFAPLIVNQVLFI